MNFDRFSALVNQSSVYCSALQRVGGTFATKEVRSLSRRPSDRSAGILARFATNP
jgi:hypothetical protein